MRIYCSGPGKNVIIRYDLKIKVLIKRLAKANVVSAEDDIKMIVGLKNPLDTRGQVL